MRWIRAFKFSRFRLRDRSQRGMSEVRKNGDKLGLILRVKDEYVLVRPFCSNNGDGNRSWLTSENFKAEIQSFSEY